ncbi:uncharacterized protein [Branchiostoma lanceolatum]|uniref:uncharacterized protein n=1 Tax=Branchiostoma lanceolatum TaxID=7740 RepID=UPI0034525E03
MSDFSELETQDDHDAVSVMTELGASPTAAPVPKRRRTTFTPEQEGILNDLWGKGMIRYGTTETRRLLEQAMTHTGLAEKKIKDWIDNRKKRVRNVAGGNPPTKRLRPTKKKRTAQNVFLSKRMRDGLSMEQAQAEYKVVLAEKGDELRLLQAEAEQAKVITIQDLSDKDKRREAQRLIKDMNELVLKFKECNLEVAVLLFSKDDGVCHIGTPKGKEFLAEQENTSALSLKFANAVNDGKVPQTPSDSSKGQLAKEVRSMFNEKYEAAGNKGKFPYKAYAAKTGRVTVLGLPEEITVDHIGSIGKGHLQTILQEKEKITVEVHSNPTPHEPSSASTGTSSPPTSVPPTSPDTSSTPILLNPGASTSTGTVLRTRDPTVILHAIQRSDVFELEAQDAEGAEEAKQSKGKGKGRGKRKGTGKAKNVKEKQFYVEKLLKKRTFNGQVEYLVKWQGYASKKATWEPDYHIPKDIRDAFGN